jgi:NADP-dependent 3-hydroxy acid dehydrogenase YdfG
MKSRRRSIYQKSASNKPNTCPEGGCQGVLTVFQEAALTQTVATYGGLHVLFNTAGGGAGEMFPAETDEGWKQVLGVNLTGTFLMCRAAWLHLVAAGGGAIIERRAYDARTYCSHRPYG